MFRFKKALSNILPTKASNNISLAFTKDFNEVCSEGNYLLLAAIRK